VETTKPLGKESVKATPVSATGFEFVIVNVRLVLPLNNMLAAPKALAIDGGPTLVIFAVTVALSTTASAWPAPAAVAV
jgi:hypothetical protein